MTRTRRAFAGATLLAVLLLLSSCTRTDEPFDLSDLGPDEVAVAAVDPPNLELELGQPIRFTFTQDLAPDGLGAGGHVDSLGATIEPPIAGVWRWESPSKLEFVPDNRFEPSATYTIVLDPEIADARLLTLRGSRVFSFRSAPLRVVSARLFLDPVQGMPRTNRIRGTFSFNAAVAAEEVRRHLSLELERRGPVEITIETDGVSEHHSFSSAPILADDRDEPLVATMGAGVPDALGDTSLEQDATETITIPSFRRLAVHNVSLARDQHAPVSDVGTPSLVTTLRFSDPVSHEEIDQHLSVDPEPADLRIEALGNQARLLGSWSFDTRYSITIDRELASERGLRLERDFKRSVYMRELPAEVRVAGSGNILAALGERAVAIETINVDRLTIEIDRVPPNNITQFLQDGSLFTPGSDVTSAANPRAGYGYFPLYKLGARVERLDLDVTAPERNRTALTRLELAELLQSDRRGVFRLTVRKADERRIGDARLVTATDLGLVAKKTSGGVMVAVVSIARLAPVSGARVQVVSYNDQVLATTRTDAQGIALFEELDAEFGSRPFIVTATVADDFAFLAFKDTRVPIGDYDIGGVQPPSSGYRGFLYSDRGIYRPGDRAHVAWITRDPLRDTPPEIPLTLRIIDPNGQTFLERKVSSGPNGHADAAVEIPDWAPTGSYNVQLRLNETTVVGTSTLRIEDFMPDRMKAVLTLTADGGTVELARPGHGLAAHLTATTLFGPPAAGRKADATLRLSRAPIRFEQWDGFSFGDATTPFAGYQEQLGTRETDADGKATWPVTIPETHDFHGWIRVEVTTEVTELGGGRAIGDRRTMTFAPELHVVGMRRVDDDGRDFAEVGTALPFETVLVDLDGRAVEPSSSTIVTVLRRRWRTVLRQNPDGRYRYVSELDEDPVLKQPLRALVAGDQPANGAVAFALTVDRHGPYRLIVEDEDRRARASLVFRVYGTGYAPWSMSTPEKLEIRLDKQAYEPGEVAKAQIEAPFDGLLLLTVERETVRDRRWVRLDSNSAVVDIPVDDWLFPNGYVVATLLRPLEDLDPRAPARAFGAVPIHVERALAETAVELRTPDRMRPRSALRVDYRIPAAAGSASTTTTLTIAAVDEGILQVTDFATPSPLDFFCARRRLSVESFDTWNLLLPEYSSIRDARPGGGEERRRKNLNPIAVKRVKPVALWSGLLEATGAWQTIELDVPEFNGALRVMAVAADAEGRFASTERLVRVRDPIVLTPNLPRVLAPGDQVRVPVQVYNGIETSAGSASDLPVTIEINAEVEGPIELLPDPDGRTDRRSIELRPESEGVVVFQVRAREAVGRATFRFGATTGDATGGTSTVSVAVETELAVRPPRPLEARVTSGMLRAGEAATHRLSSDWYGGTSYATVQVSPLPVARVAQSLTYVLRYPYGCLEQTTSRALGLLYFGDIAQAADPDAFGTDDAAYLINTALDRIAAMQLADGGFAYWPGSHSANPWATVYATHFLVEARRKNFVVPDRVFDGAIEQVANLGRSSNAPGLNQWSRRHALATRAYSLYVLALSGAPEHGAMEQLIRDSLDDLSNAARCQLAGAVGLAGNIARMRELLPATLAAGSKQRSTGYSWYSQARDDAMILDVLATVDPEHRSIPEILDRLFAETEGGRWRNTHENAWALMALGKLIESSGSEGADLTGALLVDGELVQSIGAEGTVLRSRDWGAAELRIELQGGGPAYFSIIDEGVPRGALPAGGRSEGLVVRRQYLRLDGQVIEPGDQVAQGEIVVARVSVASTGGRVDNVVVADLVPAGLEIENPRLAEHGGPSWTQTRHALRADYLDVRDDRLLLFTTAERQAREFHYGLRAVTAGTFIIPPVKAEAMYDPKVAAESGGGSLDVTP